MTVSTEHSDFLRVLKEKVKKNQMTVSTEHSQLISKIIENLRPKLLDLTLRNPLLSTKFTGRAQSYIRVVDELPDILFEKIPDKGMKFIALPSLDDDPKDEQSREFQNTLAELRLNDEIYSLELDAISPNDENEPTKLAQAERNLKDRIREKLQLPPRQTKGNLSLEQHAKNNHILPFYDLPEPNTNHENKSHYDNDIQTLLLPNIMDRYLNNILSKCNSWLQETGINVLHTAFGFLEWQTDLNKDGKTSFAPLLLLPIYMEKRKTKEGYEFWIQGNGDDLEINTVLAEKFRLEFGIELPQLEDGETPEIYFSKIASSCPKPFSKWQIRRQVAIGVFPSVSLSMYKDLDTSTWDFSQHQLISKLLGGSDTNNVSPFGDEYDVDHPEIESKVPYLITDADSSQFSVIVDVMDGKSISVEGPPGTGKSQTIVNIIASAISTGKKVLFVAEKAAALNVVNSRLAALNLGEFILPLQATNFSKSAIIESLRDRRTLIADQKTIKDVKVQSEELKKVRSELSEYIQTVSTVLGKTNLTVQEILWKSISGNTLLEGIPAFLTEGKINNIEFFTIEKLESLEDLFKELEEKLGYLQTMSDVWKDIGIGNLDPFKADEIVKLTKESEESSKQLYETRKHLCQYDLPEEISIDLLDHFQNTVKIFENNVDINILRVAEILSVQGKLRDIEQFLQDIKTTRELQNRLSNIFTLSILDPTLITKLTRLIELMHEFSIETLDKYDEEGIVTIIKRYENEIKLCQEGIQFINSVINAGLAVHDLSLGAIFDICHFIFSQPRKLLPLRNKSFENSSILTLLAQARARANGLKTHSEALNEKFFLHLTPDYEVLRNYVVILANAGFFAFLNPSYCNTKKHYKAISKCGWLNKDIATSELNSLIEWVHQSKEFNKDKNLQNLLGNHFNGIDTDFETFIDLVNYYEIIDDQFRGQQFSKIRDWLKNASIDSILSLPNPEKYQHLPQDFYKYNVDTLQRKIDLLTKELEKQRALIQEIQQLLPIFQEIDSLDIHCLTEYTKDINTLLTNRNKLTNNETIQCHLGEFFQGSDTKVEILEKIIAIGQATTSFNNVLQQAFFAILGSSTQSHVIDLITTIKKQELLTNDFLEKLSAKGNLPLLTWQILEELQEIVTKLNIASNEKSSLIKYSELYALKAKFRDEGLGFMIQDNNFLFAYTHQLSDIFKAIIYREMACKVYEKHNITLSKFTGEKLNILRARLAKLDRNIIQLNQDVLRAQLIQMANPNQGVGIGPKSEWTELSLIDNELSKKQRIIPLRNLVRRAGKALMELKPCWMMSPLSVAQYVQKGTLEFDLLIIDEASQMTPENAIGVLTRSKQAVIVGDTNQLPPTNFFRTLIDDGNIDNDDDGVVSQESILALSNSILRPSRRLRWHYRSRHDSLIAFSNKLVYNNDLIVFPSPSKQTDILGVSYVKVDGYYSSGMNTIEAKCMIDYMLQFIQKYPDLSLGVVTINQKQRDLIKEEWDYVLSHNEEAANYVEKWKQDKDGLESLFIKNLECVQGDERDVIFIGTVYGPEKEGGVVIQRFGPINSISGKRRLNVLFSRAKQRIITFSSMTASDIKADEHSNQGAYMLKHWLEYSAGGMLETGIYTEREPDSEFEKYVIAQLNSMGCEAIPQVGVAGYFIDIGVKHPRWPHGFIMGVECDGANYHSSKSARDRDRLRQEVLEGLEWTLHRIWSTDWFNNPYNEAKRLRETIEKRLTELGVISLKL